MNRPCPLPVALFVLLLAAPSLAPTAAAQAAVTDSSETLAIDLSAAKASGQWFFYNTDGGELAAFAQLTGNTGAIKDGQLILDGREVTSHAIFKPRAWKDVSLRAKFRVDPSSQGVQACGFVLRAVDTQTYYYVHFDRGQAILVRCSPEASWNEIKRVSGLTKPAGSWHEGQVECKGDTLTVWLNGQKLYEAKDSAIASPGRIGFYAGQGLVSVKDIVVSGQSSLSQTPIEVPPPQFVHVCTDGGAGGYEAFPDICRLADGRLMCVFYASYAHVGVPNDRWPRGGRVAYCISEDEGRTWSTAKTLVDTPQDDRDPSITQLRGGRLICAYFTIPDGTWMVASDDGGKTWSEPRPIAKGYFVSSPVRELSDGSLILGLYSERDGKAFGAVVKSRDGGQTWGKVVDIDNAGQYLDAETDVIELADRSLFAALRGRNGMYWSKSSDGGQTWTAAAPFGRPGHCPYLHRTVTGELIVAHRLPQTSLSISVDEGKTWANPVVVDQRIGAYPSMVNLKDGSVLVVYYEEGEGSNIRARRFRIKGGIGQWLPPADAKVAASPVRLLEARKIWDAAPHNAFTGLVRFRDQFYCAFREGQAHVSDDGALRVIASPDGRQWTSAARITDPKADLRDASICVTPDGRLMLSGAAALHQPNPVKHQTMAWFSEDGQHWSEGHPIGDPNVWLWSVAWHKGTAYGIGYSTAGREFIRLYHSKDGKKFEPLVEDLGVGSHPNESSLVFTADDTCYCLLRREAPGLVGKASPPYTQWQWKELGVQIGGPEMIQIPDGRFVGAVRLYNGPRTALCWIDVEKGPLTDLVTLPSGGDTSYPGMVWHEGVLWVSYYASHEGKTSIYLAKVQLEPKKP